MLCRACDTEKDVADFYAGVSSRCKDCHKAAMKVRRLTNPRVQEYDRLRYHTPERKAYGAANAKRWRDEHPEAYRAQTAVNNAIRDRRLAKGPCALCGTTHNVQGHHKDYAKPLDVIWLCAQCHHRVHATFPELGGHFQAAE
jgi:hypothetical protein